MGEEKVMEKKAVRKFDNPLLQSTLRKPEDRVASAAIVPAAKPHKTEMASKTSKQKVYMSPDEEKASVFEIITDLEKQLDAAYGTKDAQERELAVLKDKLGKADERIASFDAQVKELKRELVSQKELSSELEFLENERLEAIEKIKTLERQIEEKDGLAKEHEAKAREHVKELESRDARIEQIELELSSANKTVQTFQNQIALLEDEKEELGGRIDSLRVDLDEAIQDRDKQKIELERAKENMDEIRLMLAETRARTREQYYKSRKNVRQIKA
jgi:chromosome segregation ATPase